MLSYLRQCFALFSLYPKDYGCNTSKVTSLWWALRLLASPYKNMTLEDVANQYLYELHSFTTKSIVVRIILFPNATTRAINEALLNTFLSKFKYFYLACETLSRSIGKLKHLRYFNIMENYNIKKLPSSICKLQHLQVLKLDGCTKLEALPKGLRKLISLQQSEITTKKFVLPEIEIANLSSLTYLSIYSSKNLEIVFDGVKFPTLKLLIVAYCSSLKSLPMDVKTFPELETLVVKDCCNLDLELWKDQNEEQNPKLKLKFVRFWDLPQLIVLPQ
uniref:Disease resistance protein RGA2 n=1 Tax=Cajanus cajan TaxID=3821 RepID=A0A151RUX4_CAJCA|nr:Disease resistance protein RGA2 [Cajanus cajan]